MSKVAIQGNASGTGTFTIAAPNSNTDRTLTLPDEAGTVVTTASDISSLTGMATNSPYFFVRRSSVQSLTSNVTADVVFNTEELDPDNVYNSSTGIFTAPSAGIYFLSANVLLDSQGQSKSWNGYVLVADSSNVPIAATSFNYDANFPRDTSHYVSAIVSASSGSQYKIRALLETTGGGVPQISAGISSDGTFFSGFKLA